MIICFNCSSETKRLLDKLMETGQYGSYEEVISVAISNQAILQGQVLEKGALVIDRNNTLKLQPPSFSQTDGHDMEEKRPSTGKSKKATTGSNRNSVVNQTLKIPSLFLLDGLGDSITTSHLPADVWVKGQEVPLDRWLFGQYNKLLPAKANCRALAHLLRDDPKGVPLDTAVSKITDEAIILGNYLRRQDEENQIGRDDALSTAFPSGDDKTEKGRGRYANHFIASVNKQGQISGLLIDLKLINFKPGKLPRLILTDVGRQLSILRNPIFDNGQESPTQKFSKEEIALLLHHIAKNVPVEDFTYRAILTAIIEGANTPERIDESLQKYAPKDSNRNLSDSFLSTQRSGAISRMADLCLVERIRDGVRVSYIVTNKGKEYIETIK